ncbi:MAG: type IV pilus assembly protein PilM [Verrucomicrobiales bacterium]|nr:type IV pilus assembly protein PilM [Verrucomicrobiales bacterium]MCP5560228.1 type IV pilus assembly protein PilM [Verrucomicrobiaceae bacterium]
MADTKNIAVLNLGSQRVSGALFGKVGGDLVLKRYEFVDLSGDPSVDVSRAPQLRVALQELAEKLRLSKQSVWYSVAGHVVFTRFVKLPPVQPDKVDQIVEFEARQNVPFPINEVIWDYETVASDGPETEVVLVAMKADSLNEFNDQVVDAGLVTSGVDLAPMALYNGFRYNYPDVQESVVLIDLGARSTNLVFVEGDRFFTRNILVGGAAITNAIAKEFGVGFGDAEQQKVANGFVALGGAVESHPDAAVAALSKVIRNSMTRLHGEVVRTINYYRSQQGGNPPQRIFLCGGGAALGYAADFFQEKLKLPVEIFDGLRGVQLDRGIDSAEAAQAAPSMGELVGLALRSSGGCPCEVELVPDALASSRDAKRRMPALVMAGLCLWGALGTGIAYFKRADAAVQSKVQAMASEQASLKGIADDLTALDTQLEESKGQAAQLEAAVNGRSWWVRLLTELNGRMENDLLWLTLVEPTKDGKSITPMLGAISATTETPVAPPPGTPVTEPVYALHISGLYRKNAEGEQIVYRYASALAQSEFFDAKDFETKRNEYVSAEVAVDEDPYASRFDIKLPLRQPPQFKK